MNTKHLFFAVACFFMTAAQQLHSQSVGINTETPNPLTELDIRNLLNSNNDTVPKGIIIPRITEAQRNTIDVTTNKNTANSLMVYNTTEDCYNYFSMQAGEWQSLCGKTGKAVITDIDCNKIRVYGN
ncbi:MAG: hypothetical protein LBD45_07430, partial [Bacteroidales bacterium]|nr:hypothetical protein [Bacteroidales bacterium]